MAKKVAGYIKLQVPAGQANPSSAGWSRVGSAWCQHHGVLQGVQCSRPRVRSRALPIPVIITVYSDRSFTFISKTPPAAVLLRKAAGIQEGFGNTEYGKGWQGEPCAARRDCDDQDAGPDGRRHGRGSAHGCGHRAEHGDRNGGSRSNGCPFSKRNKERRATKLDSDQGLCR